MSKPTKKYGKRQQDHDIFFRGILSLTQLVEKLLRYCLDDKIKPYINFTTLKQLSDAHIDKRLRISHSDSIHECELNRDVLPEKSRFLPKLPQFRFVFLWEHKSVKQSMPIDFQIGGYDDSIKRMDFKKDAEALSIVIPIILYHGKEAWERKRLYDYFQPYLPEVLLAYITHPKFIVVDIQAMGDADIENAIDLGELRAAFIALKHGHDKKYFVQNMKEVLKFVEGMSTKELFDTYLQMLYEYMQRRAELENQEFQELVQQSNSEEMVAEFKTIFQTAREEGREEAISEFKTIFQTAREEGIEIGLVKAVKVLIRTTRMSDTAIALELDVSKEWVKSIRQEVKASMAVSESKDKKE